MCPLRSTDGQALLTDKASILNCSTDRTVNDSAIQQIPQQPVKEEMDEAPTLEEVIKAIEHLKSGKAAGIDGIQLVIWKHGGETLHSKLHKLFICCWEHYSKISDMLSSPSTRTRKNQKQQRPLGVLPDPQQSEARLCPHANSIHHLLQHDNSMGHRRSWRGKWHLNMIPYGWQTLIREQLFADDAALVANSETALQRVTSCFADASQQWRHMDTSLNPADDTFRGMTIDDLPNSERWTEGPRF